MEEQFDVNTNTNETKVNKTVFDDYYWFNGKQEPLQKIPEYSFVITDEAMAENLNTIITRSGICLNKVECKRYSVPKKAFRMSDEYRIVWLKIPTKVLSERKAAVLYSAPYYRTAEGHEVGLTNYFLVKLKAASDLAELKQFAAEHNAMVLYGDEADLWYTLTCTSASEMNALELANKAYESGRFAATDIEFVDDIQFTSAPSYNDINYSIQWNITGEYGINLDATHSITTGSDNITVAVIDNGFILNHPDMPIDAALSWDANSQTSPARQYYYNNASANNHGIGVAGIIGAAPNNDKGIAGIAPGVKLMAISARIEMRDSTDLTALNALKEAIYYAEEHNADVINNSWSTRIKHQLLDDAIESSLLYGRNGNGCVVVFASGNDSTNVSRMPYRDNTDVICVGGSTIDGYRWSGSNYSEHIDIVAPGSYIPTLGEDPEYRNPSGTSFSAPHVSAIAGLMLSVNPQLTNSQVSEILARTAVKLPDYDFSSRKEYGTWNVEVGYGLVDCYSAVCMAQNYFNRNAYCDLVEFDYSGTEVSFDIATNDDVAVIWDWDDKDITFVPRNTQMTVEHTYTTSGTHKVVVAEFIMPDGQTADCSTALKRFDLPGGDGLKTIDVKSVNSALEYVRVIGGSGITGETVCIHSLDSLKELFLVNMPDVQVEIESCTQLRSFGSSRHIWGAPTLDVTVPVVPFPGTVTPVDPNIVGGGTVTPAWPDIPEPVPSYRSLRINDCPKLKEVSLENVNIGQFDFSDFPLLQYVYVSSHNGRIVGGSANVLSPSYRGQFLDYTVSTLPERSAIFRGKILVRGVNVANTEYTEAVISSNNRTSIETTAQEKNWNVVWDSGVSSTSW